jgi:hypothetical protein
MEAGISGTSFTSEVGCGVRISLDTSNPLLQKNQDTLRKAEIIHSDAGSLTFSQHSKQIPIVRAK